MKTTSSRSWNWLIGSIYYDNNHNDTLQYKLSHFEFGEEKWNFKQVSLVLVKSTWHKYINIVVSIKVLDGRIKKLLTITELKKRKIIIMMMLMRKIHETIKNIYKKRLWEKKLSGLLFTSTIKTNLTAEVATTS